MDTENHTHPILPEILKFCAARGISACRFGEEAAGDPSLVTDLKKGRSPTHRFIEGLRNYMLTGAPAPRRKRARK